MEKENLLLERNIESVYPSKQVFLERLSSGKKFKIYLGIDPTSPEIHIGHAIALWKLKQFQKLGHEVILLVGDFTGMIGDPTDKDVMRKNLSRGEIMDNTQMYREQASKIIDFSGENPAKLVFNSTWLSKLSLDKLIELSGKITVQQLIERDMFQKRIKEGRPIGLNEFIYPLLQGYDSVALAVDAEIGGTDQTFNMLLGRTLSKTLKNKEKFVLTTPLLPGTDSRKMSKSHANIIAIGDSANDMYGKVMSLKDDLILIYFELCTEISRNELENIKTELEVKKENPMDLKRKLAFAVVKIYHGESSAKKAQEEFTRVFQKGERTSDLLSAVQFKSILPISYASLTTISGGTVSVSEAVRLAENKGLKVDGELIEDARKNLVDPTGNETIIDIGKRKSIKITWKE